MHHNVDRLDWEEAMHGPRWQRDGCDGHHERDTRGGMGSWKKDILLLDSQPQNLWHGPVAMLLVWQVWWRRQCCCSHQLILFLGFQGGSTLVGLVVGCIHMSEFWPEAMSCPDVSLCSQLLELP